MNHNYSLSQVAIIIIIPLYEFSIICPHMRNFIVRHDHSYNIIG